MTTTHEAQGEAPTIERLRELTRNIEAITESVRELRESQKEALEQQIEETNRRAQETNRRMKEADRRAQETDRRMKETDRRAQETDRRMQETDRRMRETDRQMRETDRRLKKAEDLFTTQWGKLMESLVRGDLVKLLAGRDVRVQGLARDTLKRRGGESYEVDILAVNGEEIVAVEVKTTLRPEDVRRFRSKLGRFKEWWPEYRDRKVYGAMAFLQASDHVALHAERQGFFVIRATGDSASIVNAEDFEPRVFA